MCVLSVCSRVVLFAMFLALAGCSASTPPPADASMVREARPRDLPSTPDLGAPDQRADATPSALLTRRYFLLIYNPILESQGGKRLIAHRRYNNPDTLIAGYVGDILKASHNSLRYVEAARLEVDDYPKKEDGFVYDDTKYLACLANKKNCHKPDMADGYGYIIDYAAMLAKYKICDKFNKKEIDELWVMAAPYMGMWEANQAGKGAFFTNGPVVKSTSCNGILNVMGFNYERGVAEMLEDIAHRTEGTMRWVYGGNKGNWAKFIQYDKTHPGSAQCGNVHFAPNSDKDYDWGNRRRVKTYCDDWLNYPTLPGVAKTVDCTEWGCDSREHKVWWLSHLPHATGKGPDGKLANWWTYIAHLNR